MSKGAINTAMWSWFNIAWKGFAGTKRTRADIADAKRVIPKRKRPAKQPQALNSFLVRVAQRLAAATQTDIVAQGHHIRQHLGRIIDRPGLIFKSFLGLAIEVFGFFKHLCRKSSNN